MSVTFANAEPSIADVGDYIELMKPRVMSLAVFTALVGLSVAPGHIHPVIGFNYMLKDRQKSEFIPCRRSHYRRGCGLPSEFLYPLVRARRTRAGLFFLAIFAAPETAGRRGDRRHPRQLDQRRD